MSLYGLVLFLHVAAVLALFVCLSFEALSLFLLRRASTLAEARLWVQPVPRLPLWTGVSALVILVSGIYLAMRMSAFGQAWIDLTIVALLAIAPLGALTGKRMRTIRQALTNASTLERDLISRLDDSLLQVSLSMRICIFLGIVLLMAAKPGLLPSVSIVVSSIFLGLLWPLAFWRRRTLVSATGTAVGNR
jgi:hypothetical protein